VRPAVLTSTLEHQTTRRTGCHAIQRIVLPPEMVHPRICQIVKDRYSIQDKPRLASLPAEAHLKPRVSYPIECPFS